MNDKMLLNNLVKKYGKDKVLEVVNEAFKSDRMRNYDDKIRKHNKGITDKAKSDRMSRMDRLYKKYYDPENFDGDNSDLDYNDRSDNPETNRRRYETTASNIQYAFDRFMKDNKIDSLHNILNKYGVNYIDWHNVSDEDFIQVDKSKIRKYTRGWNFIVFWEDRNGDIFAITRDNNVLYIRRSLRKGRYNADKTKIKDLIEDSNVSGAIVLDASKYDTSSLRRSREDARHGMIDRTKNQNEQIRQQNINRYKRIIAQNNISKFDVIDKDVRSAVKNFALFTSNDDADLNVVLKANELIGELLKYYANFTAHRRYLKKASSADDNTGYYIIGNFGTGDYHNEKVKHFSTLIRQTLKKLDALI